MFSHLPQYERETSLSLKVGFSNEDFDKVHPAILSLGLKYGEGKITGSSNRAVSMLLAFKSVINDYKTPPGKAFARDLDKKLKPLIQFLIDCRPHSITMGNAIKHLRYVLSNIPVDMSENEAKQLLFETIESYIENNVILAQQAVSDNGAKKINNGDVLLTYGHSTATRDVCFV